MDVYIKPAKQAQIIGRRIIYLKDVAEIFGGEQLHLGQTIVGEIREAGKSMQLVSALDLVQALVRKHPDQTLTVNNVGEVETVVTYLPTAKKDPVVWHWIKICAISLVLFMGGATAIMSFHADADISGIMQAYYKVVFGAESQNPLILEIPYSLGLGIGILVFFNHFSLWRLSDDPTPIEVQMTTYENEVNTCLADNLEKKQKSGGQKGKGEPAGKRRTRSGKNPSEGKQRSKANQRKPEDLRETEADKRKPEDLRETEASKRRPEDLRETEADKRKLEDLRETEVGKRKPEDLRGTEVGKRKPEDLRGTEVGKRKPEDLRETEVGKRKPEDLRETEVGKRKPEEPQRVETSKSASEGNRQSETGKDGKA